MSPNNPHRRKRVLHRRSNLPFDKNNSTRRNHQNDNSYNTTRKKTDELKCVVCEGPAFGYNFDAISCESCKAFFRRNALRSDVCMNNMSTFFF